MVGDLGLGKSLDMSSRLTMIAGTPTYVAPEQAAAESPDARADQYSLAALAFLLLTGRPPFSHTSLSDAMHPGEVASVSTRGAALPARGRRGAPPRAVPRPRQRYPTVTEFVTALAGALGPTGGGPTTAALARTATPSSPSPAPGPRCSRPPTRCRSRPSPRGAAGGSPSWARRPAGAGRRRGRRVRRAALARRRPTGPSPTSNGTISVTVPEAWASQALDGWVPPNADAATFAALSVGTEKGWADSADGQGVFAGLLSSTELPTRCPSTRSATPRAGRSWTA